MARATVPTTLMLAVMLTAAGSAAAAAPARSDTLATRGATALDRSNYPDAMRLLEQAVTADPKNARAFSLLGLAHHQLGENGAAEKYFDIALQIDPDDTMALSYGGRLDLVSGDKASADVKLARLERLCTETDAACQAFEGLKAAFRALPIDEAATQRP